MAARWSFLPRYCSAGILAGMPSQTKPSMKRLTLAQQLRSRTALVLGLGLITWLLAGAGFWWLEPTIQSYWDGLWLAFTTGATVGYGDFVPTVGRDGNHCRVAGRPGRGAYRT